LKLGKCLDIARIEGLIDVTASSKDASNSSPRRPSFGGVGDAKNSYSPMAIARRLR
jgi:hypothetical protein